MMTAFYRSLVLAMLSLALAPSPAKATDVPIYSVLTETFTYPEAGDAQPAIKADLYFEYETNVCGAGSDILPAVVRVVTDDLKTVYASLEAYGGGSSSGTICTAASITDFTSASYNVLLEPGIKAYELVVITQQSGGLKFLTWRFTQDEIGKWSVARHDI